MSQLKTRRIIKTESGGFEGVFGQGSKNWVYGAEALATILEGKVRTVRGEIITHANFGVQWFDSVAKENLDAEIRNILLSDERVFRISSFNSVLDLSNQKYNATIELETTEGLLELDI